MYKQLKELQ